MHRSGLDLLAELDRCARPVPPMVLSGQEGEHLIRLCYLASAYESVYRGGPVDPGSPLSRADADTTLPLLLDQVPDYALADIGGQLELAAHREALGWTTESGRSPVCGPEFAGSADVGGADADLICDGELIDCKATVQPARLGAREIRQLAGYLLLDYTDQYQIRALSLYLSRQGATITWNTSEFLARLGARRPLPQLRELLIDHLERQAA
ncbi:hypothetical protein [Streptomyces sp. TLI_171]|uniref:hypothetical protein n=1 Tax=Streptomyces sp. TLI_171 TaxID=1938859 RepID=UPI000C195FD4|nr:hypothetical protein [Streptomyces sp. TLI_171]